MANVITPKILLAAILCVGIAGHRPKLGWFGMLQHQWIKSPSSTLSCPQEKSQTRHRQHNGSHAPTSAIRGGDQEVTLDEKVQQAMQKLGIATTRLPPPPPPSEASTQSETISDDKETPLDNCQDGVCTIPPTPPPSSLDQSDTNRNLITEDQVIEAAKSLAESMNVDQSLALAALSATSVHDENNRQRLFDRDAGRQMIQQELNMISQIPEDSPLVHALIAEGFDPFLSRRALAFAEANIADARAILLADKEDEEQQLRDEEEEARQQQEQQEQEAKEESEIASSGPENPDRTVFPTVTVDSDIDPTRLPIKESSSPSEESMPKPTKKEDVVFEATSEQIQELVLESPVPVLVDVYADWCGPCKVLTPALEEITQKSGGIFRLVKVNTDKEKSVSTALEVTALPTVFGVKNGRIVHMFQGMPRSEEGLKNFLMGLLGDESSFDPPLTANQRAKYDNLTTKLVRMASAASFPFSSRERLKDRVVAQLDSLVVQAGNDASRAEESAKVVRSLLSNIIQNPTHLKFRTAKLSNAVLTAKIVPYPAALGLLKSVGFRQSINDDNTVVLALSPDKTVVNVAPLVTARESIDKWIDKSRYEIAKAVRQRNDEAERSRLQAEGRFEKSSEEEEEEDPDTSDNLNTCFLKVRLAWKKKVYEISLAATDRLSTVLDQLPAVSGDDKVQITCVAKKLIVESSDATMMEEKTLQELGLTPSASLVVDVRKKLVTEEISEPDSRTKSKLGQRAQNQKRKKKGSHTMQSVGIYSKDDNAKAELIDGGGGVWYEHDVSDDEEEEKEGDKDDDLQPQEDELEEE